MSTMPRAHTSKVRFSPAGSKRGQLFPKQPGRGLSDVEMMKRTIDEFGRSSSLNTSHLLRLQKIKKTFLIAKRERGRSTNSPRRSTVSSKKRNEPISRQTSQEQNTYRAEESMPHAMTLQPEQNSTLSQTEEPLETEKSRNDAIRALSIEELEEKLMGERNKGIKWRLQKNRNIRREGVSNATTRATSFSSQTELPQIASQRLQSERKNPPVYLGVELDKDWVQKIRDGKSLRQIEVQSIKAYLPGNTSSQHSRNENKFYRRAKQSIFTSVAPSVESLQSKRPNQFNLLNFNKSSIRGPYQDLSQLSIEQPKPLSGVLYKSVGFSKLDPDSRPNVNNIADSMVDLKSQRNQSIVSTDTKEQGLASPRTKYLLTNVEDIRNILATEYHQENPRINATRKLIASRKFKAVNRSFIAFVRPECFTKQVIREKLWTEEETRLL